jgi:hypothetical protein
MRALALALLLAACTADKPTNTCTPDLTGVFATFSVENDNFTASITDAAGINEAIALATGADTRALIPTGTLVCTADGSNCGWQWHLDPATVTFINFTDPFCDGTPTDLDTICPNFAPTYCPSAAVMIHLLDCRAGPCVPVK